MLSRILAAGRWYQDTKLTKAGVEDRGDADGVMTLGIIGLWSNGGGWEH